MAEYIVLNPVVIEAEFKDGEVMRYPQEIRERIVRCRDCIHAMGRTCARFYEPDDDGYGWFPVDIIPDDFCAWGEERDAT